MVGELDSGRMRTVGVLERVDYKKLSNLWDAGPADWNRTRAGVSAFLTSYLGHVHHPVRLSIMRINTFSVEQDDEVPPPS